MFIFQKYATFWQRLTKSPQNLLALIAGATAFLLLLLILFLQSTLPPIAQQEVELPVDAGVLKGTLWLPLTPSAVPGVVLVHGMASSRRGMQHLAKTLAYQGMGAFVFDLQGYGESSAIKAQTPHAIYRENVIESLRFLQSHPAIQSHHIAFVGHSLGADVLSQLPESTPGLRIAVGLHPDSPAPQSTLQWWTGLYDPLHPPYVHSGTNSYVSPCTGHSGAPEDLCLAQQLQKTLATAFSLPSTSAHQVLKAHLHHGGMVLLGTCLLLLVLALPLAPRGYPLLLPTLIALTPFVLAGYFRWLYPPYCASAMVLISLAYFLRQWPLSALQKGGQLLGGLWAVHLGVSTLRGMYALFTAPTLSFGGFGAFGALLQWPLFVLQSALLPLQTIHDKALAWGFTQTYARTEPGLFLIAVFMVEIIWPGGIVRVVRRVLNRSLRAQRSVGTQVLPLLVLMAGLGVLAYWRYQQGFLNINILQNIGPLFWGVILPELLIFGFLYKRFCRSIAKVAPPR